MAKGYIHSCVAVRNGEDWREDIHFASLSENAARWSSAEAAEIDCADLNRGVKIQSAIGQICLIRDFKVEEISPGEYSISCDLPFIGYPIEPLP